MMIILSNYVLPFLNSFILSFFSQGSLEVTGLVDRWRAYEMAPSPIMGDAPKMTREQRLMKVVRELLETEREHVKVIILRA